MKVSKPIDLNKLPRGLNITTSGTSTPVSSHEWTTLDEVNDNVNSLGKSNAAKALQQIMDILNKRYEYLNKNCKTESQKVQKEEFLFIKEHIHNIMWEYFITTAMDLDPESDSEQINNILSSFLKYQGVQL